MSYKAWIFFQSVSHRRRVFFLRIESGHFKMQEREKQKKTTMLRFFLALSQLTSIGLVSFDSEAVGNLKLEVHLQALQACDNARDVQHVQYITCMVV